MDDDNIDIDNNFAEAQIKNFALGRKNWQKHSSNSGAEASAMLYSLALTCKARGIDPYKYFVKALSAAPYCKTQADWEDLVPD